MPVRQNPQDRGEKQDERQHAPRVDALRSSALLAGLPGAWRLGPLGGLGLIREASARRGNGLAQALSGDVGR